MRLKRNTPLHRLRAAVHYVSSCIIAKDKKWLSQAPNKLLVLAAAPVGWALSQYIKHKAKK